MSEQPQSQEPQADSNQVNSAPGSPPDWQLQEWECIQQRREKAHGIKNDRSSPPQQVTGLSLSGGGIRSALFNDGFLQGLSHRGLLRYVDYLCSVSGGGYIAGHLASQARCEPVKKEEATGDEASWHDLKLGKESDKVVEPSDLGRDRVSGKVDKARLAGIGGYLSRPFVFIPAYLWSFAFSLAFYLGIFGIIAVLAALFWRSFDGIIFRELFGETLGFYEQGNELLIAFLPFFALLFVTIVGEGLLLLARGLSKPYDADAAKPDDFWLENFHSGFRAWTLVGLIFAASASLAVFLGNGKSSIRGGSELIYLNRYAQVLAIIAACIQVLVFLGRDKLFKSELGNAKGWQRQLQQSVTAFVIFMTVFSMIHWMGRENISGFTNQRDPYLVVGDVTDWHAFAKLNEGITAQENGEANEYPSRKNEELDPDGSWRKSLAASRLGWPIDFVHHSELSVPDVPLVESDASENDKGFFDTPVDSWGLIRRSTGGMYGYVRCMYGGNIPLVGHLFPTINEEIEALENRRRHRQQLVATFNREILCQPELTDSLIALVRDQEEFSDPGGVQVEPAISKLPKRLTRRDSLADSDLGRDERELIVRVSRMIHTDLSERSLLWEEARAADGESEFDRKTMIAHANRLLLEDLFPGVIQSSSVASTFVVPPHDQATRKRWLVIWLAILLVGLVGGFGPFRMRTVFHFYRHQLATNFLVPSFGKRVVVGDRPMSKIKPHLDGLPYPLILAAALRPLKRNGSYRVGSRPFLFTPHFAGSFEKGETPIPSEHVRFNNSRNAESINLGDAVTLSGAAVTPLMTENRWLSGVMDFFNTGIGQYVWRTDGGKAPESVAPRHPVLTSLLFASLATGMSVLILEMRFSCILVFAAVAMICSQWLCRIGSPGLIRSMLCAPASLPGETINHHRNFYVADGGYQDYLGVSELLRRRCDLIIVSDAGANVGEDSLGTLGRMCERASRDFGIRFVDLDHESPIDFGRLEMNDERLVHQPYICMRVRYPDDPQRPSSPREGMLIYCQMSITDSDPIEIKHIRNLFPSFPDEPTVNQFYNDKQVTAYRTLGYHIASRLCSELHPWDVRGMEDSGTEDGESGSADRSVGSEIPNDVTTRNFLDALTPAMVVVDSEVQGVQEHTNTQPYFEVLKERLLTGYRLACFEEVSYQKDDIFAEAIWHSRTFAFPTFHKVADQLGEIIGSGEESERRFGRGFADQWLRQYESNADIRSAYRAAVIHDINQVGMSDAILCHTLFSFLEEELGPLVGGSDDSRQLLLHGHLTAIAVACQEIHRGRPHATFQVGGREKLIDLCRRVGRHMTECPAINGADVLQTTCIQEKVIAELIEMEHAVFQRGEHVSTISFAQCMTTLWGRISRTDIGDLEADDLLDLGEGTVYFGTPQSRRSGGSVRPVINADALDLVSATARQQLNIGLSKVQFGKLRNALRMSWLLGFLRSSDFEFLRSKQPEKPDPNQKSADITPQPSSRE